MGVDTPPLETAVLNKTCLNRLIKLYASITVLSAASVAQKSNMLELSTEKSYLSSLIRFSQVLTIGQPAVSATMKRYCEISHGLDCLMANHSHWGLNWGRNYPKLDSLLANPRIS